jgi:hypothetical protein
MNQHDFVASRRVGDTNFNGIEVTADRGGVDVGDIEAGEDPPAFLVEGTIALASPRTARMA